MSFIGKEFTMIRAAIILFVVMCAMVLVTVIGCVLIRQQLCREVGVIYSCLLNIPHDALVDCGQAQFFLEEQRI